jgi:hypothetical protein
MTAEQDGAGTGPPDPHKEGAAPAKGGSLETRETTGKVVVSAVSVKLEARQHLERWLKTGNSYHLALARAKFDALRKDREHGEWLKQQGATPEYGRHMIAAGIIARRAELRKANL